MFWSTFHLHVAYTKIKSLHVEKILLKYVYWIENIFNVRKKIII